MTHNLSYSALCKKDDLIYTSCYCEENVWKLLNSLPQYEHNNLYAVFISNESKTIPIWYQSKSENINTPVIWDYHVIAVHKSNDKSYVYDLDTLLNFPINFETYYEKALKLIPNIKQKYQRMYRVVSAKYYLENFASDRSHMIDKETGNYLAQPPNYECIKCNQSNHNLHEFTTMNQTSQHGILMNEKQFEEYFISSS